MLKLKDLAVRPDFQAGLLRISPSRRLVEGPEGCVSVEPVIMQVLLLLLEARGRVVTRDELFDQVWGGAIVGDDSLNRAVGRVRRILDQAAPGQLEIETIPRTGYRLTGEILGAANGQSAAMNVADRVVSRRTLVAGGAATAVTLATAGLWMANSRTNPRFDALMERGRDALRYDQPGAASFFEKAAAARPDDATALGLLAYALGVMVEDQPAEVSGKTAQAAERAARAALRINPEEPNALVARAILESDSLDWFSREERYLRVLAIDPANTFAMRHLGQLLHGVGRCRDSYAINERAIAIEPLSPILQLRKAMRLWVLGRIADADRVSNRALDLWPRHRLLRMARLMIYAFSGRPQAAMAMVEDEEANPNLLSPGAASVWRASLVALASPTPATIAAAREANVAGSKRTPAIAAWAILALSALGEVDAAFDVANGFLLGRGSLIVRPKAESRLGLSGPGWRNTYGLFTPPTAAMRLDPRFRGLSEGLGLVEYWRRRGIGPDAFLFKA